MPDPILRHSLVGWLIGFGLVSLLLGLVVSFIVWKGLHAYFEYLKRTREWKQTEPPIPLYPVTTGILERLLFTLLIAFQVSGVGAGLIAWIALKMTIGWGRLKESDTRSRALAFTGLLSSLASLLFAVVGGLICNGLIPLYRVSLNLCP